ncbi:ATP-binding cassette domain-containing protein [Myxococcus stipitatus]|uniref:ATP-binding cassette domain-containing protein n=1 Tax=Myxococcus stipitatus TaxID=83455 RepID=UPI001F1D0B47|nr:ATP-binding cassette domain-containing protein [Myxococcus stipitatus]MCE9669809.1 ATP-binding cassette domain-containing protein [Myxococcus stipitatus]
MTSTPLLELKGVSKRFGAIQALSQVDFEVHAGEVVALVGDNGAGKSTLVKTLAGILPVEGGQVFFEGRPVRLTRPREAASLGIATVHQDLALCDNLDVVANLFLGREVRSRGWRRLVGWLDETAMEVQATELLRGLAVSLPSVRTQVATLSGGQRQSIAVARAMMGAPRVVLLDEPTAALGVAQTRQVLDLIRRLRQQGLGVVVISHNLADVFCVTDRIVVMRLGRRTATFDARSAREVDVVAAITGVPASDAATPLAQEAP